MVLTNYTKKQELTFGSGSGVIISNKEIATNCHVAMAEPDAKDLDFAKKDLKWNLKNQMTPLLFRLFSMVKIGQKQN